MVTALTLFCLVVDKRKVPIGDVFKVEVQSDDCASDLRKVIKVEKAPELDHLAADRLTLWKLLVPLHIDEDEDYFDAIIKGIELPPPKSIQALEGYGDVQALRPGKELSTYWENSPERGHLHIVVQVPFVAPSNFWTVNRWIIVGLIGSILYECRNLKVSSITHTCSQLYLLLDKYEFTKTCVRLIAKGSAEWDGFLRTLTAV